MNFTGYLIEGSYDGETLNVTPRNRASRVALLGDPKAPDLALSRQFIAGVTHKEPSALVNGHVTVATADGRKFVLHFRKKQADDMRALVDALA
jgi:hypothetical protein